MDAETVGGDVSGEDHRAVGARFTEAMASRDPGRVAAALSELRDLPPPRAPVPPPEPEVLDVFLDGAPGEVVRDYIWVLAHHRPFVPPLPPDETLRRWVDAVVRHPLARLPYKWFCTFATRIGHPAPMSPMSSPTWPPAVSSPDERSAAPSTLRDTSSTTRKPTPVRCVRWPRGRADLCSTASSTQLPHVRREDRVGLGSSWERGNCPNGQVPPPKKRSLRHSAQPA